MFTCIPKIFAADHYIPSLLPFLVTIRTNSEIPSRESVGLGDALGMHGMSESGRAKAN